MGMDSNVEIEVNDKLENYEAQLKDQIQMSSLSLEDNTTLRQLDLNQQLLNHNLAISKTSFLPTVSLSGAYLYTSMSDNWNLFKYKYNPYVYATLNVTIPIFRAKNWTSLKKVKMQQRELALNRTNAERQINMQVQTYLDNMSASQEQVESNKEAVVKSEKARTIAEKRYEVGKGTILELNSSVVDVTSAKLTYKQSIYDYLSARTDLNYVLGHESKYLEMEPEDDGSVLKAKKPAKENANNNDNK
jgi:outer membrane protein TolC